MRRIFIIQSIRYGMILFAILFYTYLAIKRHGDIFGNRPLGDVGEHFFKIHKRGANMVCHIFMLVTLILFSVSYYIPMALDLPSVIKNDFISDNGEVVRWDFSQPNTSKLRHISIKDENGNITELRLVVKEMHPGDYIYVEYWEHSKIGHVVKRIGKK